MYLVKYQGIASLENIQAMELMARLFLQADQLGIKRIDSGGEWSLFDTNFNVGDLRLDTHLVRRFSFSRYSYSSW